MKLRSGVPLSPLTTLRIGGSARYLADLEREDDVVEAVREADVRGEPLFVLGDGSNVVVADEGFPGLVGAMGIRGVRVERTAQRAVVDVSAGERWDPFVERCVAEGWRGVECLSGIPGRVGATPIQNVGAYGQEVSDCIVSVRAFDRETGTFETIGGASCAFGYRTSIFKRQDRWIVTSVRFSFELGGESAPVRYAELARALGVVEGASAPSARVRDVVVALRRGKGMVLRADDPDSVSAGSFFVNPVVDTATLARIGAIAGVRPPHFEAGADRFKVAAAWLVEGAGFTKGWGAGRVGVSRRHALALVNRGGASARELLDCARAIRDGVRAMFGVSLEPEPVFVGCAWDEAHAESRP